MRILYLLTLVSFFPLVNSLLHFLYFQLASGEQSCRLAQRKTQTKRIPTKQEQSSLYKFIMQTENKHANK